MTFLFLGPATLAEDREVKEGREGREVKEGRGGREGREDGSRELLGDC